MTAVQDSSVVEVDAVEAVEQPRVRIRRIDPDTVVAFLASAIGSFALTWFVFSSVLPLTGAVGFVIVWYVVFLVLLAAVSAATLDRVGVVDRVMNAVFTTAGLSLVVALGSIVGFTVVRGWAALSNLRTFLTETTAFISPDAPLDQGGIYAAIVGSLQQIGISMLVSVPLGVATAVYLTEVKGPLARPVRTVVESMSAVPTIVAGLFVYSLAILSLGWERSGFAAALALSVSMLPVVTTTAEVVLRLVPQGLREAALALGSTQWQTVRGVVLPTARQGLVTAVLLGVARVIGETSPVLLVAGLTNELNYNPFSGPQLSLPLFVFNQVRYPLDTAIARAFGAAVVLLLVVVVLFALARVVGGRPPGVPGPITRWRRRRAARPA